MNVYEKSKLLILQMLIVGLFFAGCDLGTGNSSSLGNNKKPPSAPYLQGTYNASQTWLSWDAVQDADGYYIYTSTRAEPNSLHKIADVSGTSYTHYTTQPYNYAIKAYNSYGNSPLSNFVNTY